MTTKEKLGQLCQFNASLFRDNDAKITGPILKYDLNHEDLSNMGSVLNFRSVTDMREIQKAHLESDRNKIPMTFMMDVIHGYKTIYPIPLALGCSFDVDTVTECSRMAATEAAASGIHVTFTPMVDYVRDARWGRVLETCGEEPMLNGIMGAAQVRAFHGDGLKNHDTLATCVKHFAGYGGAEAGRDYNTVELSEHALWEYYLPAYKACIDAGATMLMPSFNSLGGVPSTANKWLMNTVLFEKWAFDGVVISDYNAVGELIKHGVAKDKKEAAKMAFECGCDIEMCSTAYYNNLETLIDEGVFTMDMLDKAVYKVLRMKEELGLFDDPYRGASEEASAKVCLCKKHRDIAKRAAEKCAVLLKNDGVLPFSKNTENIAIIGPFAHEHEINGWWDCRGDANDTVSVKEGIQRLLPSASITVAKGCSAEWDELDTDGFAEAIDAAKKADIVILCLGEPMSYSGEGNCRTDLDLPGVQNELASAVIAANPNTAAVLFNGRPLSVTKLDRIAPAILDMWFPGTEGGSAAAALLFGDANPQGKLSMTFPKTVGQCPIYYNHPSTGRPKKPEQDNERIGYHSTYIDCGNLPLYPFGYGLSYSNFVYEKMELSADKMTSSDKIKVSVTVRNDSDREGIETVQLYLHDLVASTVRPVSQLIAFKKVTILPRSSKTVDFEIDESMLRIWNDKHEHVSEPGEFTLSTGYADNLNFTTKFELV